ncbi:MAG: thioredoxin [Terrimicrobiaceae bacterium]|nr:thioredoxin [Terrimicrobiaceae bacterium]
MASANVIELTDANFDTEVIASSTPVLVDFWAPWCGPCRMIAPLIDEIADEKVGAVKVGKVNVDDNPQTAAKFRIQAIPTMLIFKNGEKRDQITGLTSKGDLVTKLDAAA